MFISIYGKYRLCKTYLIIQSLFLCQKTSSLNMYILYMYSLFTNMSLNSFFSNTDVKIEGEGTSIGEVSSSIIVNDETIYDDVYLSPSIGLKLYVCLRH